MSQASAQLIISIVTITKLFFLVFLGQSSFIFYVLTLNPMALEVIVDLVILYKMRVICEMS